ncbi:hypothetical protein AX15_006907 [Amanita polypyramis BW_CC]|nr:hypothetical protein AX15_006907 [Amanita polypyramis BW_CC]
MYATRVQGRQILLENPAKESKTKIQEDEKRLRRRARLERKRLGVTGRKEAKEKGFWNFDKTQVTFHNMLPLHHLWMGYMSELLGLAPLSTAMEMRPAPPMPSSASMHAKLVKADLHGSMIKVHQSKNTSVLGLSGIVILDTANTFSIVTRQDKVKLVPKQNSIFTFAAPLYQIVKPPVTQESLSGHQANEIPADYDTLTVLDVPHIEFKLYGNQFRFRSADRAGRKFKHKETIEL